MATAPQRRKVLVLKDGPSIRNLLILVKKLEREDALEGKGKEVLASINRRKFGEVMIDLRYPKLQAGPEIHGIREIRPNWVGKMLVITVEVNGPRTLGLVERYLSNRLPQTLLWLICHP